MPGVFATLRASFMRCEQEKWGPLSLSWKRWIFENVPSLLFYLWGEVNEEGRLGGVEIWAVTVDLNTTFTRI